MRERDTLVVVADDDPRLVEGLSTLIEGSDDWRVGVSDRRRGLQPLLATHTPDLLVVLQGPRRDADRELLRRVESISPLTECLFLPPEEVERALTGNARARKTIRAAVSRILRTHVSIGSFARRPADALRA